jgi:tetratricopeptide (TPR) repeat protein
MFKDRAKASQAPVCSSFQAYLTQSNQCIEAGDYETSLIYASKACDLNPNDRFLRHSMAYCNQRLGHLQEAAFHYSFLLENDNIPETELFIFSASFNLAWISERLGDLMTAKRAHDRSVSCSTNLEHLENALFQRATFHNKHGKRSLAKQDYYRLDEIAPNSLLTISLTGQFE